MCVNRPLLWYGNERLSFLNIKLINFEIECASSVGCLKEVRTLLSGVT